MDGSHAKRNQKIGIKLLEITLLHLNCLPKREFLNVKECEDYFSSNKEIIIDATEQIIQRPKELEEQENTYSGKKNTFKVMMISAQNSSRID